MTTKRKKILNRPHAFPQNFLTYRVANDPESSLEKSDLKDKGQVYKLKGPYNSKSVVSKMFGSIDGRTVNEKFLNLENHKISSLVPELVLYKVFEENGKVQELRPFYFPVAADYLIDGNKVNLSKPFSGNGAVVENFSITFTSQEVYEASRKFVEASLVLSVDHMATLFEKEDSTDYAPLVDLFTISAGSRSRAGRIPKSKSKGKTITPNALDNGFSCRVAATMGYNVPRNGIFDSTEIQVIESSKCFVNLYYKGHSIDFDQNGSVKVNVSYTGYLSAIENESMYNLVTNSHGKVNSSRFKAPADQLGEDINKFMGEKNKEKSEEKQETTEEEDSNLTILDIQEQFAQVIGHLYEEEKIYTETFAPKEFLEASGHLKKSMQLATEAEREESNVDFKNFDVSEPDTVEAPESVFLRERIKYVSFGDFVEAYLHVINRQLEEAIQIIEDSTEGAGEEEEAMGAEAYAPTLFKPAQAAEMTRYLSTLKNKLTDSKILLANFRTETIEVGSAEPKDVSINIADVPVSLDTIYTYVYRNLSLTKKLFFDINEFLTRMCLNILNTSLVEKPNCEILRDVSFVVSKISSRDFKKKTRRGIIKIDDIPAPVGNYSKQSGKDVIEYILFHQAPQIGVSPGSGDFSEDAKNGIFHLRLGQTHGLLKTINFQKQSDPGREAYLVIKNGRGYDELRLPHNATAEMVGNNMFLPMSFVYINPDTVGFGDPRMEFSSSRRLGLGGYYVVGNVTTTYAGGNLTTTLQMYFNAFPDSENKTSFESTQLKSINKLTKSMSGESSQDEEEEG